MCSVADCDRRVISTGVFYDVLITIYAIIFYIGMLAAIIVSSIFFGKYIKQAMEKDRRKAAEQTREPGLRTRTHRHVFLKYGISCFSLALYPFLCVAYCFHRFTEPDLYSGFAALPLIFGFPFVIVADIFSTIIGINLLKAKKYILADISLALVLLTISLYVAFFIRTFTYT